MQKNKPLRLVVDTNIWISFIISDKLSLFDDLLLSKKVRFLFSAELIAEIKAVINKPKLAKYFTKITSVDEMFEAFGSYIDFVIVEQNVSLCRDPNDDFLLSLAQDGKADYILTGDKDLLDLNPFGKVKIITVSDFLNQYSK